jgi:hypothetical protein
MATNAAPARHSSRPATTPRRGKPERADLGVLDRRHVLDRARRRQARVLMALSASLVAAALVLAAAGHALLASDQVTADTMNSNVAAAIATQQNDQLVRAQLEAPNRILSIAESGLKMVTPGSVTYLPPVNPGPSVAEAHGAPAPAAAGATKHRAKQVGHSPGSPPRAARSSH